MSACINASFTRRFPGGAYVAIENLRTRDLPGVTVLFGPSGSGKTTVLRCLVGLEQPDAGTVQFGDETWSNHSTGAFLPPRNRRVGFVPQNYALFPHLNVEENIAYGLSGLSAGERAERVAEVVEWLRLGGLEQRRPRELSGGEQQRVALGRAVVWRPRLLLLDEPFGALDLPARARLRYDLRRQLLELRIPTLLVTHDRAEAVALGDDIVVMNGGRNVQQGSVLGVFQRPATLGVAEALAVETIQPGRVKTVGDLVTVEIAGHELTALSTDLVEGTSEVYICIRAEDVVLVRGEAGSSSARNALPGLVRSINLEGPIARVELDCGFALFASLTRQGCEQLALELGTRVVAQIKAPHIHLIPRAVG